MGMVFAKLEGGMVVEEAVVGTDIVEGIGDRSMRLVDLACELM